MHDFVTKHHLTEEQKNRGVVNGVLSVISSILFLLTVYIAGDTFTNIFLTILLFLNMSLWAFCTISFWYVVIWHTWRRQFREWHGLEHKIATLLEQEISPTVENIRKMPRILFRCGTVELTLLWEFLTLSWMGMYFAGKGIFEGFPVSLIIYVLLCASVAGAEFLIIFRYYIDSPVKIFLYLFFAMPALVIPLLIEAFCTTKEPARDKVESVLEDVKALYARLCKQGVVVFYL